MGSREDLQDLLENMLGSRNVYFQPPENITLKYPCIVYHVYPGDIQHADNLAYVYTKRYEITYIYTDPDSEIVHNIAQLPLCDHERHFTSDNLYHDVYTLYF